MKRSKGFTITELVISIIVIGILATIATMSMMSVRKGSRDTVRETNALTIAEELERYYEQHGEYPGCSALTASANDIRANTLKNIEIGALLTPNIDSNSTNAIRCDDITPGSQDDYFAYVGDSSPDCISGNNCAFWTLKYHRETDGSIGKISSRRQRKDIPIAAIDAPIGLTISASLIGTLARGEGSGGVCESGAAIERQIRHRSTSTPTDGTWSAWNTTAQLDTPANEGHQYTFEQRARCTTGVNNSDWAHSDTASTIRPIAIAPAPVTISVSPSPTAIVFTRIDTACPTGTSLGYQHRYVSDEGTDTGWVGSSSNPTYTWTTANQGYEYQLGIQARCLSHFSTGPWGEAGNAAYIRPIETPTAPVDFTHTVASDRKSRLWEWTPPICGPGTLNAFRFNSYLGPGSLTWSLTGEAGWMYGPGPNDWSPQGRWTPRHNITTSPGTFTYGVDVQQKVQYMCVNPTTGRTSSWGPAATSPMMQT